MHACVHRFKFQPSADCTAAVACRYCGGTEIGGGFLSGCLLQPQAPSTFSTPTLGASLVLLAEDGTQHPHSTTAGPVTG